MFRFLFNLILVTVFFQTTLFAEEIKVFEFTNKEFGETIDILTNNKLGKIEWIEYRNLKDGWGAFKEIHDGTCSAPKIVLLP